MSSLAIKAVVGLGQILVLLAVVLFLSAGTLRYWEAWLYLLVFGGASLLTTVYFLKHDPELIERRLRIGPKAETRTAQKIIVSAIRTVSLLLLVIPGLDRRFGWSNLPAWIVIAANLVLLLGYRIIFAVFQANSFTAATVAVDPTQQVISTGPYAVVRHPMYAGSLLMVVATPIALGSWWGLPVALAMAVGVAFRILDEEKLLREQLPGYEDYYHKVRFRLIPQLW